jgi:uncharacterized protein (DUF433 family)
MENSHIAIDPSVCLGKPHIKGTRLSADLLQNLLATGYTRENILETYPYLTAAEVDEALSVPKAP